jgi:hypothetical protein
MVQTNDKWFIRTDLSHIPILYDLGLYLDSTLQAMPRNTSVTFTLHQSATRNKIHTPLGESQYLLARWVTKVSVLVIIIIIIAHKSFRAQVQHNWFNLRTLPCLIVPFQHSASIDKLDVLLQYSCRCHPHGPVPTKICPPARQCIPVLGILRACHSLASPEAGDPHTWWYVLCVE